MSELAESALLKSFQISQYNPSHDPIDGLLTSLMSSLLILSKEPLHVGSRPMPTPRALLVRAIGALDRSHTRYELPCIPPVSHHHPISAGLSEEFRAVDTQVA